MRKYLVWFALLMMVTSMFQGCKSDKREKPEHLLSKEEMIEITTDIQLVEAALSYRRNLGLDFRNIRETYYSLLFEKHDITAKIYEDNLTYYNQNPQRMEDIYEAVLQNLEQISAINQEKDSLINEQNIPDGAR